MNDSLNMGTSMKIEIYRLGLGRISGIWPEKSRISVHIWQDMRNNPAGYPSSGRKSQIRLNSNIDKEINGHTRTTVIK